ncbi:hypothetical protein P2318_15030 [Myxococcaceae bacterium GXIMD 01537]
MRRRLLALLLALSSPALAQQPAAPAAPAAPPAAAVAEAAEPAKAPEDPEAANREHVRSVARFLFQSLILGDARSVTSELVFPFQLEEKRYTTADELIGAWVKELRARRADLITLYDVEVLTLAELEKKYGKPPARLGLNLTGISQGYAAVGNLSGRPAIFLFRSVPEGLRAFAYTD